VGRVLAVVSQKGGVGKTTTAINLAAALAQRGTKILLVDADPQGSIRYGLGLFGDHHRYGLSDFLLGTHWMHQVVYPTMLPWMRTVLAGTITEQGDHDSYHHSLATSPRLLELLTRARERGYVVIIDTPPGLGPIANRVMGLADDVIVPLQCEPLALQTTSQILRGIRVAAKHNPKLTLDGVLLTMYESGNAASEQVAQFVRAQLPKEMVFDIAIPRTDASIEAFAVGQPLVLRAPDDPAARAYGELADQLASRLQ
jgi:chromosome partitioning protein